MKKPRVLKKYKPRSVLSVIDVGSSVAEQDRNLEKYFVETEAFRQLLDDSADVVAGDKGSGKSAIYKMLGDRRNYIHKADDIEIIQGFNVQGNPVFQRLIEQDHLDEKKFRAVWKAYIFSLVGSWLVNVFGSAYNDKLARLNAILVALGLDSASSEPEGVFSGLMEWLKGTKRISRVSVEFTITETQLPIIRPSIEFDGKAEGQASIYCDDMMAALNAAIASCDIRIWVALDRLDEAFSGEPALEVKALRGLLRAYLDLSGYSSVSLKLFLRRDLFKRILVGGFTNLSHIYARRVEIEWSVEDLIWVIEKRVGAVPEVLDALGISRPNHGELFERLFPRDVELEKHRMPIKSWLTVWLSDARGAIPPRNLIDLVKRACEIQLRRENRSPRGELTYDHSVIESASLIEAMKIVSRLRVEDTLLAEAGPLVEVIEKFRGRRSDHDLKSIKQLLIDDGSKISSTIDSLIHIGFLQRKSDRFIVPVLYHFGLGIISGRESLGDAKEFLK